MSVKIKYEFNGLGRTEMVIKADSLGEAATRLYQIFPRVYRRGTSLSFEVQ